MSLCKFPGVSCSKEGNKLVHGSSLSIYPNTGGKGGIDLAKGPKTRGSSEKTFHFGC